jgi:hypothetical protein
MIFHIYKIYIFLKYLYFTNLVKKRPSKQLSKCSMAPLNNCNELGPLSACAKEVRNRKVITPRTRIGRMGLFPRPILFSLLPIPPLEGSYAHYVDRFFRARALRAAPVHAAYQLRWKLLPPFTNIRYLDTLAS